MVLKKMVLAGVVAGLMGCVDQSPTALPLGAEAGLAKGGGSGGGGAVLYQAVLIAETGTGEIISEPFPAAGFSVSASNPWKQRSFSNVTLTLNNSTQGDWGQGQCALFDSNFGLPYSKSYWDIYTNEIPTGESYAGEWSGTVTIGKGYFAFDGDRVGGPGGIHNVVTQNNPVVETADAVSFTQRVRNAPFKFGSASAPGETPLPNAEVACVNYTIVLKKMGTP